MNIVRKASLYPCIWRRCFATSGLARSTYEEKYRESIQNPSEFWGRVASNTVWTQPWTQVMDNSRPPFTKWFVGGRLSLCYNAVDRHVDEGHGEDKALIWDSPISGNKLSLRYGELKQQVSHLAATLSKLGLKKGDRVLIYMPMIPEAVIGMLATIRLGAVHSVVFGGFSAKELAKRIQHCQPKLILSANCGLEPDKTIQYQPMVEEALVLANAPSVPVLVYQRPGLPEWSVRSQMQQFLWQDVADANGQHDCVDVDSNDPLYILYTSGTTGIPKGVMHTTGGHAVVNKWTMGAVYGIQPGEVWWASSDMGWILGHEYICYSPLMNKNTSVMYEGKPIGTPDAGQFFRVISEHEVSGFFVAPTALRAIKMADPTAQFAKKYNLSKLRSVFVAGEHCDHETRIWAETHFKAPALNNWWQTETAHAITASCIGLGHSLNPPRDVAGKPVPGFNVKILREDGSEAGIDELGRIVCQLPLPPGTLASLYQADDAFVLTYFSKHKGYYDTMDAGTRDAEGYIKVLSREDDVINVAGHRLSTSAMEEAILSHPDVIDCAVIGVPDSMKGHVPLALFVLKQGATETKVQKDLVEIVRKQIGPVAAFRLSISVPALPRTRSGKTARRSIADLAAGKPLIIPPTVEDPNVYEPIRNALQNLGFCRTLSNK